MLKRIRILHDLCNTAASTTTTAMIPLQPLLSIKIIIEEGSTDEIEGVKKHYQKQIAVRT
ncbi:MAG: hypothetical protein WA421_00800 [Nitrososphaeraceae archaeon]